MARQELGMTLPEELVERILAMMPFPHIFKARVLSKSWLARLSPISPQDDDDKKRLVISFQKRVGELFTKWKTFSPVFVYKKGLIAYDQASDCWVRTPSLSFVPEKVAAQFDTPPILQVDGALVLMFRYPDLYVSNVLTKSCKHLPLCPEEPNAEGELNRRFSSCADIGYLVSDSLSGTYKVVRFCQNETHSLVALIYDSKSDAWSRKMINLPGEFHKFQALGPRVSFNGLSYWLVGAGCLPTALMAFNFKEEAFEIFQVPHTAVPSHLRGRENWASLVVCNASLLMVVCGIMGYTVFFTVLKIDLESQRWFEVTQRSFPGALKLGTVSESQRWLEVTQRKFPGALKLGTVSNQVSSDGTSIFLVGQTGENGTILVYNVRKDEVSTSLIPAFVSRSYFTSTDAIWNSPSFEPGLNPFAAV